MVNKPKIQGTKWESEVVRVAKAHDCIAGRIAEGGSLDKGDVFLGNDPDFRGDPIIAVAWKRLVKSGGERRAPDGEKEVVILTLHDFLDLMGATTWNAIIECKATQTLNVTRILHNAREKAL